MGTVTNSPTRLTLPDIARQLGASLDSLREKVRRNPAAEALFERIGGVRCIDTARLDEFRQLVGK